jgi:hypothetical protein
MGSMTKIRFAVPLALSFSLGLAACVTPTAYAPAANPRGVGFSEMRIQSDRVRVRFQGGGGASMGQVQSYALLRAAELTLEGGYDWFRVDNRYVEQTGYQGASASIGGGGGSYGRHGGIGIGTGLSFPLNGGPQLAVNLEITMGKGPRPDSPDAYDARDVSKSIGGRS